MKLEYTITNNNYTKIHQVLKMKFNMSKKLILRLKKASKIYCNGSITNINSNLNIGDKIYIDISFDEECENIIPVKMALDILYEDDGLLVLNKPINTPVHPSLNHYTDSLSNGVKYYFNEIGLKRKIRPINRLDKDTSGIVLFAKNEYMQECLVKQMKTNEFQKEYLALLDGILQTPHQTVTAPIARKDTSIIERCISIYGEYAETDIDLIEVYSSYSLVKCSLKTGRTHQIRVHTKHIGFPILDDTLYGNSSKLISRQALHASKVSFIHPITEEKIIICSEIPQDMLLLINTKKWS